MTEPVAARAFREHYLDVYRFLLRRTHDRDRAEELTSSVFADAAASLHDRAGDPPLLAWLYRVAERRFVDDVRRRQTAQAAERRLPLLSEAAPEYGTEVAAAVRRAVEALPREQRRVVVARLFEGRTFAAIASRQGSTEAAMKMRFGRGIEAVRESLRREGFGS